MSVFPLAGKYYWHSRFKSSFNAVARITDSFQHAVLRHLLRRCLNIDVVWLFGRPTWDHFHDQVSNGLGRNLRLFQDTLIYHPCCAFMGWLTVEAQRNMVTMFSRTAAHLLNRPVLDFSDEQIQHMIPRRRTLPNLPPSLSTLQNGREVSVVLTDEARDILDEYSFHHASVQQAVGSRISLESAVANGTGHAFGEWTCSNSDCGGTSITRYNSRCGIAISDGKGGMKQCNGMKKMMKGEGGVLIRGAEYGGAQHCLCVGILGESVGCACSGGSGPGRMKGRFILGFDMERFSRTPPGIKSMAVYQSCEKSGAIQKSWVGHGYSGLQDHLRQELATIADGMGGEDIVKRNYPWAVKTRGGVFTRTFTLKPLCSFKASLTDEFMQNPNRDIVVNGHCYRMRPWDLSRGEV